MKKQHQMKWLWLLALQIIKFSNYALYYYKSVIKIFPEYVTFAFILTFLIILKSIDVKVYLNGCFLLNVRVIPRKSSYSITHASSKIRGIWDNTLVEHRGHLSISPFILKHVQLQWHLFVTYYQNVIWKSLPTNLLLFYVNVLRR